VQLKKLYINSFKTFAGKFEFDFKDGITAVVGPNGSGKSNLSDAIRWALGEQSIKLLRGSTMSDVIFSGTSSRKQSGMAEVSIVIDNRDRSIPLDFDEVSVTRRVFRDGESHFLLNNVECRLRDITDIFAGTGLGKETYAAIEQGKVDAIISSQPSDRRGIFDEASGIMRYKNRKKEAEKKLTDVDERTGRAAEVIEELSAKAPALEQQAQAAKVYREAKAELDETEFSLICSEVTESRAKLDASEKRLIMAAETRARYEIEVAEQEGMYESLKVKHAELDLSYEAAYLSYQAASSSASRHELMLKDKKAEQDRYAMRLDRAASDEVEIKEKIRQSEEELKSKMEILRKARNSREEAQERLKLKNLEIGRHLNEAKELESSDERFRAEHFDLVSKVAEMRSSRGSLIERARQSESRKERLNALITELYSESESCKLKAADADNLIVGAQLEAEGLRAKLQSSAAEIHRSLDRSSQLDAKLKALESDISKKEATLAGLESLQAEHEGYPASVKSLLAARDGGELAGIISSVGDAIKVPEGMEAAIEAGLGSQINDIICLSSDDAVKGVGYLKEKRSGKATFLPLDIIRPSEMQKIERIKQQPGFLGIASELIGFEKMISPAIQYLLGNTAVFKDLDSALEMQRKGLRARAVTLDGESITYGGAVTGGTRQADQSSVIRRRNRMEALNGEIAALGKAIMKAKCELKETNDETSRHKLAALETQSRLNGLEARISELSSERAMLIEKSSSLEEQCHLIESELKNLSAEDGMNDQIIAELEEGILKAEELVILHERRNLSLKKSKQDLDSLISRLTEEATQLKISAAREDEVLKALEAAISNESSKRDRDIARLEEVQAEKARLASLLLTLTSEIEHEEGLAQVYSQEASRYATELEVIKKLKDQSSSNMLEIEGTIKTKRRRLASAQAAENEASIEKALLTGEFETLSSRLQKDHGISYADIPAEKLVPIDKAEASASIEALRRTLADLGDVNLMANEELEALTTRISFMKGQIDDLEKARASLVQVIREAERTAKKQFLEMFEQIRLQFRVLFERLFDGGQADIVMVDPDDPLESGIEIICRPPGKKLSQLSLLSGGEKALAAIALVFSFLKVRPAPFCILDEIDAALDDANLDRFRELVTEYSKNSQIIIITHRRSTMEAAGRVYGVTMEEQGVSKSVCIDTSQIQFQEGIV